MFDPQSIPPPDTSRQLIQVRSAGWDAATGTLTRHERDHAASPWRTAGDPVPVELGNNGLAWGAGTPPPAGVLPKAEGDGKTPAGLFRLEPVFGYAPAEDAAVRALRMPYLAITGRLLWVDDPASAHYNRPVTEGDVPADWASSERMLRADGLYRWGLVIRYNTDPPVAGAGSAIFMHIRRAPGAPTRGCTAMAEADLITLIRWLDADLNPMLLQWVAPNERM